MKLQEP